MLTDEKLTSTTPADKAVDSDARLESAMPPELVEDGEPERKSFCFSCGKASADPDTCEHCGDVSADADYLGITIVVSMYNCDQCGHVGPALACPECGFVEPNPTRLALARRKAFEPLLGDLKSILASFDDITEPHLPVSFLQFNQAVSDGRIYDLASEVSGFFEARGGFVLDTTQEVSRRLRPVVVDFVRHCETIRARIAEVAWCDPPADYRDMRDAMISLGRQVVTFAVRLVELIMIVDGEEAREHKPRLQAALEGIDHGRYTAALDAFRAAGFEDQSDNDVVCRVFGVSGAFVSDEGDLNLPALLQALDRGDVGTLAASSKSVAGILKVLPGDSIADAPIMSMLIGQLVGIATSRSPARTHRLMSYFSRALADAWHADKSATTDAIARIARDSRRMINAQMRISRRAVIADATEDHLARFELLADMYRIGAEGAFRTYASLANDVSAIVAGGGERDTGLATLGEIVPQFRRYPDELARLLIDAIDVDLRNALAHESYEVVLGDDEAWIRLLDSAREVSIDDLEDQFLRLQSLVTGLDVVATAWMAQHDLEFDDLDDDTHPAHDFVSAHLFAGAGVALVSVGNDNGAVSVEIDGDPPAGISGLLAPLTALLHRFGSDLTYEVVRDNELLVRAEGADLRKYAFVDSEEGVSKQVRVVAVSAAALLSTTGRTVLDSLETRSLAAHLVTVLARGYIEDESEERIAHARQGANLAWAFLADLGDAKALPKPFTRPASIALRAPSRAMFEQALIELEAWRDGAGELLEFPLINSGLTRLASTVHWGHSSSTPQSGRP